VGHERVDGAEKEVEGVEQGMSEVRNRTNVRGGCRIRSGSGSGLGLGPWAELGSCKGQDQFHGLDMRSI
jgi:hypothetical protein